MKKEVPIWPITIKLVFMYWVFLVVVALFAGCSAPRERRGDWMEHLNEKQFNFNAPTVAWDRHNYYSLDELKEMWAITYERAVADLNNKED